MRALRANALWILACTGLVMAGAWFYAQAAKPSYVAQAGVVLESRVVAGTTPVAPAMGTEKQIASSGVVIDRAAATLGLVPDALSARLTVSVPPDANVLNIACAAPRAAEAKRCAQTVADDYIAYRNTALGGDQRSIQASLVTAASLPGAPSGNSLAVTLGLAAFAGLVLGVAVAFLRDVTSDRLRGRDDLATQSGLAVLATVPRVAGRSLLRRSALVAPEQVSMSDPGSAAAEAFRYLRVRLEGLSGSGLPGTVVVVTSSSKREGRTTVAVNLAVSLARGGTDVVLVDADLNRGRIAELVGVADGIGLAEVLASGGSIRDAVQQTKIPHLSCVSGGTSRAAAANLVGEHRMVDLLAELVAAGSVVVVDAGSLLDHADAVALTGVADVVLFVANARRSNRSVVRRASQELGGMRVNAVAGAVLNDVHRRMGERLPVARVDALSAPSAARRPGASSAGASEPGAAAPAAASPAVASPAAAAPVASPAVRAEPKLYSEGVLGQQSSGHGFSPSGSGSGSFGRDTAGVGPRLAPPSGRGSDAGLTWLPPPFAEPTPPVTPTTQATSQSWDASTPSNRGARPSESGRPANRTSAEDAQQDGESEPDSLVDLTERARPGVLDTAPLSIATSKGRSFSGANGSATATLDSSVNGVSVAGSPTKPAAVAGNGSPANRGETTGNGTSGSQANGSPANRGETTGNADKGSPANGSQPGRSETAGGQTGAAKAGGGDAVGSDEGAESWE